jgi:hypothetical protein
VVIGYDDFEGDHLWSILPEGHHDELTPAEQIVDDIDVLLSAIWQGSFALGGAFLLAWAIGAIIGRWFS